MDNDAEKTNGNCGETCEEMQVLLRHVVPADGRHVIDSPL